MTDLFGRTFSIELFWEDDLIYFPYVTIAAERVALLLHCDWSLFPPSTENLSRRPPRYPSASFIRIHAFNFRSLYEKQK
jgi:hypothetical protein